MNVIHHHTHGGQMVYEKVLGLHGDGQALIGILREGLRLRKLRRHLHRMSDAELRQAIANRRYAEETEG